MGQWTRDVRMYSVEEIDRMRKALRDKLGPGAMWQIEIVLQTYIIAMVEPEELEQATHGQGAEK